jgi:hypothetical protein
MALDSRWLAPAGLQSVQDDYPPADHWLGRLCQAILEDALKCLGTPGRDQREAWDWVISEAEYCFSFPTVCAVLQLNAEAVRSEARHRFAPGRAQQGGLFRLPRHQGGAQRVRRAVPRGLTPVVSRQ